MTEKQQNDINFYSFCCHDSRLLANPPISFVATCGWPAAHGT